MLNQLRENILHLDKRKIITEKGNNSTLIKSIHSFFPLAVKQLKKVAPIFDKGNAYDSARAIHKFLSTNIFYYKDDASHQKIKLPSRLLKELKGDCKSFSLFAGAILQNLGYPVIFRYTGYKIGVNIPSHVYIVTIDEDKNFIILDGVLNKFDSQKPYVFKIDYPMKIEAIAGHEPINGRFRRRKKRRPFSRIRKKNYSKRFRDFPPVQRKLISNINRNFRKIKAAKNLRRKIRGLRNKPGKTLNIFEKIAARQSPKIRSIRNFRNRRFRNLSRSGISSDMQAQAITNLIGEISNLPAPKQREILNNLRPNNRLQVLEALKESRNESLYHYPDSFTQPKLLYQDSNLLQSETGTGIQSDVSYFNENQTSELTGIYGRRKKRRQRRRRRRAKRKAKREARRQRRLKKRSQRKGFQRRQKRRIERTKKKLDKRINKGKGDKERAKRLRARLDILENKLKGDRAGLLAARKKNRKRRVKRAKKAGQKVVRVLNKINPLFGIGRGAFLALVRLNYRGLALNINKILTDPKYAKDRGKLWKRWQDFGGSKKRLKTAVSKGKNKKILQAFKGKKKADIKNYNKWVEAGRKGTPPKVRGIGDGGISIAATVSAAGAVLGAIAGIVGKIMGSKGKSQAAKALQTTSDTLNVTSELTNSLASNDDNNQDKGKAIDMLNLVKEVSQDAGKVKFIKNIKDKLNSNPVTKNIIARGGSSLNNLTERLEEKFQEKTLQNFGTKKDIKDFEIEKTDLYDTKPVKSGIEKALPFAAMAAAALYLF